MKPFLGNFYRNLAIFIWSHCTPSTLFPDLIDFFIFTNVCLLNLSFNCALEQKIENKCRKWFTTRKVKLVVICSTLALVQVLGRYSPSVCHTNILWKRNVDKILKTPKTVSVEAWRVLCDNSKDLKRAKAKLLAVGGDSQNWIAFKNQNTS